MLSENTIMFVVVWSLPTYQCCQDLCLQGWKCIIKLWSSGRIMVLRKSQHETIYAATAVNRELSKTKNWKSCLKLCFPFVMDVEQRVKKFINGGLLKQLLPTEKEKKIHEDIFCQFNIHSFYATLLLCVYYSLNLHLSFVNNMYDVRCIY